MSEASSGSGSPQSSMGLSNRKSGRYHVVTFVCASQWKKKTFLKGHTFDFCGLTNLLLPKKRKKKIGPAWGKREGGGG